MREVTERHEGVWAGTVKLVGASREKILGAAQELLDNPDCYQAMAQAKWRRRAAQKIVAILIQGIAEKQG